jgi:hypothetical protein
MIKMDLPTSDLIALRTFIYWHCVCIFAIIKQFYSCNHFSYIQSHRYIVCSMISIFLNLILYFVWSKISAEYYSVSFTVFHPIDTYSIKKALCMMSVKNNVISNYLTNYCLIRFDNNKLSLGKNVKLIFELFPFAYLCISWEVLEWLLLYIFCIWGVILNRICNLPMSRENLLVKSYLIRWNWLIFVDRFTGK